MPEWYIEYLKTTMPNGTQVWMPVTHWISLEEYVMTFATKQDAESFFKTVPIKIAYNVLPVDENTWSYD